MNQTDQAQRGRPRTWAEGERAQVTLVLPAELKAQLFAAVPRGEVSAWVARQVAAGLRRRGRGKREKGGE